MSKKISNTAPPIPRAELSDNPVKLCNEIARIFRTKMRESGAHDGIMSQPGARLVLSLLAISDGLSQRELAERTRLRAPTVSVIIRRMAEEKMVELRPDESDMRVKKVYLTELGRRTDSDNIKKIKSTDAKGLRGISEEEYGVLMLLLGRIRDNLLVGEENNEENI